MSLWTRRASPRRSPSRPTQKKSPKSRWKKMMKGSQKLRRKMTKMTKAKRVTREKMATKLRRKEKMRTMLRRRARTRKSATMATATRCMRCASYLPLASYPAYIFPHLSQSDLDELSSPSTSPPPPQTVPSRTSRLKITLKLPTQKPTRVRRAAAQKDKDPDSAIESEDDDDQPRGSKRPLTTRQAVLASVVGSSHVSLGAFPVSGESRSRTYRRV
ncbi:hypothetical protein EI94DRAFT_1321419 [Lactarius quietus]|nr:hypothetical protein EI94DRAFT_1321419 [Lactarius quietus]